MLANRAPFTHEHTRDGRVSLKRSASGLVTALEPLVEACAGIWVAHGAGNADTACADDRGGLDVPPANPQYRLRYVWLPDHEHRGYYYGFANEGLWPLCHAVHVQPVFRSDRLPHVPARECTLRSSRLRGGRGHLAPGTGAGLSLRARPADSSKPASPEHGGGLLAHSLAFSARVQGLSLGPGTA